MSAKTFGTFRPKTKTVASRPDEWAGDELRNCVVRVQHDIAASTQSVAHGISINLSIYMSICVCVSLGTRLPGCLCIRSLFLSFHL